MAFQGLNSVVIIGYVKDMPEIRETSNGKLVANFIIPTMEMWAGGKKTEWHRIVAWGKTAEIIQNYVRKGSLIRIAGKLQTRSWEDQTGLKRHSTEIVVIPGGLMFLGGKAKQNEPAQDEGQPPVDDDEDIPF